MIAVQGMGGGGERNRLCYRIMYWTQMGRVWEGYPQGRNRCRLSGGARAKKFPVSGG